MDREVYVPDELLEIVREMQRRIELFTGNGNKRERDFIKRYSRIFKEACRNVGIENKHFHNLRHTYAVRRYLQTQDIYLVAKELGHSSVTTTEIYAKFNLRHLKQDFPSLTFAYNNKNKRPVIGIRDTDSRDTLIASNTIARG
jgi:integrase